MRKLGVMPICLPIIGGVDYKYSSHTSFANKLKKEIISLSIIQMMEIGIIWDLLQQWVLKHHLDIKIIKLHNIQVIIWHGRILRNADGLKQKIIIQKQNSVLLGFHKRSTMKLFIKNIPGCYIARNVFI